MKIREGLLSGRITFGLPEAVIFAVVAVGIACTVVYYQVT